MQLTKNEILKLAATLASTIALYRIYQKFKRKTRFHLVGHVSEIVTYPVKGMRGVALTRGKITNLGIFVGSILDRGFMVVNQETKTMVNAKQHPKLVSVLVEICGEGLILSVPNMEKKLVLKKPEHSDKVEDVIVWRVNARVFDCGEVAAEWVTKFLDSKTGGKFRVYYFDPEHSLQTGRIHR